MYLSRVLLVIVASPFVAAAEGANLKIYQDALHWHQPSHPATEMTSAILDSNVSEVDMSQQSKYLFDLMKNGIPGCLPSFSPLHEDRIEVEHPHMTAVLTNVTLSGMNQCQVEYLSFKPKIYTYYFIVRCPQLFLTADYSVNGTLDFQPIDHEGSTHWTLDNYKVTITGQDIKYDDQNDKKTRVYVKTFVIEKETVTKATVHAKSVRHEDNGKAASLQAYCKNMWLHGDKKQDPIMTKFWAKYIDFLDKVLQAVAFDNVLQYRLTITNLKSSLGMFLNVTNIPSVANVTDIPPLNNVITNSGLKTTV